MQPDQSKPVLFLDWRKTFTVICIISAVFFANFITFHAQAIHQNSYQEYKSNRNRFNQNWLIVYKAPLPTEHHNLYWIPLPAVSITADESNISLGFWPERSNTNQYFSIISFQYFIHSLSFVL